MRNIIHDWSDKYCHIILRHLRQAATPSTQLVIFDSVMAHACVEPEMPGIRGAVRDLPPLPLLPNKGHGSGIPYFQDLIVRDISEILRHYR